MSAGADRERVRRAALRVGLLVGAASAVVIAAGVALLVAVILATARPDDRHESDHVDADRLVVDVDHVLPWVVVLGIIGVLVLGAVAWLAARRAVRPLSDALRAQRSFVADAGHELRTPLTALTSRIQIVQRRLARGEPLDATVSELRRDAATLDAVLTDMLLTAEGAAVDEGSAEAARAAQAAVDTLEPLAEENGVTLRATGGAEVAARMPEVTLTRLCVALLDNAIGHAPPGSVVEIGVRGEGAVVEIRVSDAGTGIPAEDRDRIFDRFARGEESGRRRGFGLGLALVREAATRYGGSIRVERSTPAGTTMLLTLPVA